MTVANIMFNVEILVPSSAPLEYNQNQYEYPPPPQNEKLGGGGGCCTYPFVHVCGYSRKLK